MEECFCVPRQFLLYIDSLVAEHNCTHIYIYIIYIYAYIDIYTYIYVCVCVCVCVCMLVYR
jgi:hypothetical protein